MTLQNQNIGKIGENLAKNYISRLRYKVIYQNYRTRMGEIDLIAISPENVLTFIEVKTRVGIKKGMPYEAVNYYKLKHLKGAIDYFLLQKDYGQSKLSIAVISIVLKANHEVETINLYTGVGLS